MDKFDGNTTFEMSVKLSEKGTATPVVVTCDWTGYTPEMAKYDLCASTSPRVLLQSRIRNNGIPDGRKMSVKMCELRMRQLTGPVTYERVEANATALTREERIALMARMQAQIDAENTPDAQ